MFRMFLAALESEMNRGMVSELEAAAPEAAVKAAVGVGAKLRLTVAVPAGGEFCATLEV
jgi:hypothetical protein